MFTNYSKIPIKLAILLVGFGLLVVGCDSAGPSANDSEEEVDENPYTAVNDLDDRITSFGNDGSTNAVSSSAAKANTPSFTVTNRVASPDVDSDGNPERASHLSLEKGFSGGGNLYVGYKVQGSGYGGGIDIIDVSSGGFTDASSSGGDALTVDGLDIQELTVGSSREALFVATADQPDNFGGAPKFHSIDIATNNGLPGSSVDYDEVEFSGTLVKSVVTGTNNSSYEAFAVSDANTFHQVSINSSSSSAYQINSVDTEEASSGTRFRSVANLGGTAYGLSDGGNIYELSSLGVGNPINGSPLATLGSDSIARMSAHTVDANGSSDFLFVALNDGGFRVFDTNKEKVVYSDTDLYATSVTATENLVYVATGDGLAVYEVEAGLNNDNASDGLRDIGRASISDFNINGGSIPTPTDAQVNHIVVDDKGNTDPNDNVLYLAKSTDGVYKLTQNSGDDYN